MPISISCPNCGKDYNLADSQRGKKVACRQCDRPFVVEDGSARAGRDERDEDERDRRRERDRERDREPPRRTRRVRRSGGGLVLWLLMGGGLAVLVVTLVVALVLTLGVFGPSKVTPENYARLRTGMSEAEVRAVLGKPTRDATQEAFDKALRLTGRADLVNKANDGRTKVLLWESGKNRVTVTLRDDRLIGSTGSFEASGKR